MSCGDRLPVLDEVVGRPQMSGRELVVTGNITLDGVIEATEGWFAPADDDGEVDRSDVEAALREQSEAADALLLGRVTFEQMRGYWPLQSDDTTGIRDYLNNVSSEGASGQRGRRDKGHHAQAEASGSATAVGPRALHPR
jgi:dihydrofolate reductase